MITFWIAAAIMIAIALAFVLPPFLEQRSSTESDTDDHETNVAVYRDQLTELETELQRGLIGAEQYQQDREEIESRLLSDVPAPAKPTVRSSSGIAPRRGTVYALALGIPVVAIGFYSQIGTPSAISGQSASPSRPPFASSSQSAQPGEAGADGPMTQQRIEGNIAALARRLEEDPQNVDGWRMLARSYSSLEKYAEASNAYARATALKTDDADLWADYALAKTMANGQQMAGEPIALIEKSLKLDPENPKALQLSGGAAFQAKRYEEAASTWERVLKKLPPDSELAQALKQKIDEAKALAKK